MRSSRAPTRRFLASSLRAVSEPSGDFRKRFLVSLAVAVRDFARAHEQRALEGVVGRLVGLFEVTLEEILPLLALGFAALDGLFGGGIAGAKLEQALVRLDGALVVEELVFENARELELHGELDRRAGVESRLELEQLGYCVPLATHSRVRVARTRGGLRSSGCAMPASGEVTASKRSFHEASLSASS